MILCSVASLAHYCDIVHAAYDIVCGIFLARFNSLRHTKETMTLWCEDFFYNVMMGTTATKDCVSGAFLRALERAAEDSLMRRSSYT